MKRTRTIIGLEGESGSFDFLVVEIRAESHRKTVYVLHRCSEIAMPAEVERLFMEPLDTDLQAMVRGPRPATPGSRLNALLILPIFGLLLMLVFVMAAIFQLDLSELIDSLMGLVTLFFFVLVGMLFWAMAPRGHNA